MALQLKADLELCEIFAFIIQIASSPARVSITFESWLRLLARVLPLLHTLIESGARL